MQTALGAVGKVFGSLPLRLESRMGPMTGTLYPFQASSTMLVRRMLVRRMLLDGLPFCRRRELRVLFLLMPISRIPVLQPVAAGLVDYSSRIAPYSDGPLNLHRTRLQPPTLPQVSRW